MSLVSLHNRVSANLAFIMQNHDVRVPEVKEVFRHLGFQRVSDMPEDEKMERRLYELLQTRPDSRAAVMELERRERERAATAKAKEKEETDKLYEELTGKVAPLWERIDNYNLQQDMYQRMYQQIWSEDDKKAAQKIIDELTEEQREQAHKTFLADYESLEMRVAGFSGLSADYIVFDEAADLDTSVFQKLRPSAPCRWSACPTKTRFTVQKEEKDMCDNAELEKAKTGAEILAAIEAGVAETAKRSLYQTLRTTTTMIRKRQAWIEARTSQMQRLQDIQADLVKKFDANTLTKADMNAAVKLISDIENEKVTEHESMF